MNKENFDISIIRPELRAEDFKLRREGIPPRRLKSIKKGLHALHTLETMAANIYKFQITKREDEINHYLIAAMCNEMTHLQDFQVKLFEYGFKPSKLRWAYWIVGFAFGFFSRLIGKKAILKTGIWVERRAVSHYDELLRDIEWDEETRKIIEKDQTDEYGHIDRWRDLLGIRS
ncbi:MAG: demethoxyubiquinone hydroxylase family protein [Candidatus Aminicenantes bacterium]|nr:MAG: demethoxyubiquinone hydroxylase family protein [Candidatus Aminicenantes bacterium]